LKRLNLYCLNAEAIISCSVPEIPIYLATAFQQLTAALISFSYGIHLRICKVGIFLFANFFLTACHGVDREDDSTKPLHHLAKVTIFKTNNDISECEA